MAGGKRLRGEYFHTIDKKGRMSIPAKFRETFGDMLMMAKGPNHCLYFYPIEEWEKAEEKVLNAENSSTPQGKFLIRNFIGGSQDVEIDAMGRVLVPQSLREFAGLTDKMDVVVVGVGSKAEVWPKAHWAETMEEDSKILDYDQCLSDFGL